jgi:hypothetical protein
MFENSLRYFPVSPIEILYVFLKPFEKIILSSISVPSNVVEHQFNFHLKLSEITAASSGFFFFLLMKEL